MPERPVFSASRAPDQAEGGASAELGGKAAAGESDPTVQSGESTGGEENAANKSDADDETSNDDPPPFTKLSQLGGLKATEGTQIRKSDGTLGPASHPLDSHGPDKPLNVADGPNSVEQRMIDNTNMMNSTKFMDRATMETAIGKAIDANATNISNWLSTSPPAGRNMPAFDHDPGMGNLGSGFSRPARGAPYSPSGPLSSVTTVLKSNGVGGYVIQTAFPSQ